MPRKLLILWLGLAAGLLARDRIAYIEFYGYTGIDVEAVRRALPFREGDKRSKSIERRAREAVRRVTGRDATGVSQICCVGDGDGTIFIGLPGESSRTFIPDPAPNGDAPVAAELRKLYEKMQKAEFAAMSKGHGETEIVGYRLMKERGAAAAEMAVRGYALKHEQELLRTLSGDRRPSERAIAADALGYGARTARQIAALVQAARDADDGVRNWAVRALSEILRADSSIASQAPAEPFLDLVRSGVWTDRNKGAMVLWPLTESRDPQLLARVRSEAWDALVEMARWRVAGWSTPARFILARAAGMPEARIVALVDGPADAFFAALDAYPTPSGVPRRRHANMRPHVSGTDAVIVR